MSGAGEPGPALAELSAHVQTCQPERARQMQSRLQQIAEQLSGRLIPDAARQLTKQVGGGSSFVDVGCRCVFYIMLLFFWKKKSLSDTLPIYFLTCKQIHEGNKESVHSRSFYKYFWHSHFSILTGHDNDNCLLCILASLCSVTYRYTSRSARRALTPCPRTPCP